ncbi:hypothetical protein BCR43DRAFT_457333 [Syncephalastrum racemosum]|uniref:Steroid 5-alpha reductase C-terminal domain-containing protein n=1 Tax=Syncephalastrum racemosum TaxID=13706 RepID=A0A1X2HGK7_SYNRA|nr:hypothetical protein BCR43DRAFT_457333 [Syncephalastrum racemosum]
MVDLTALSWDNAQNTLLSTAQSFFESAQQGQLTATLQEVVNDPSVLLHYYRTTDAFALAIGVSCFLALFHCVMGELTRNYSQVDKAWSFLPPLYIWHYAFHDYLNRTYFHPRLLLAAVLTSIWGIRLTYNFARKGGYEWSGRDYRFVYIQEKLGNVGMALLNFVFIGPVQDILLAFMATPLYFVSFSQQASLHWLDGVVTILFLLLLAIEVIADDQQWLFQTKKHALLEYLDKSQLDGDYKRGFLTSGLFKYSRHPNFFAEQCIWWTIYGFSIATVAQEDKFFDWSDYASYINWTVAGALFLTMLFQGSTWLTELISSEKYPAYRDYQKSVSRFVPWFPSRPKQQQQQKQQPRALAKKKKKAH